MQDNDDRITFLISESEKIAFNRKARKNKTNGSLLLREWVKAYIHSETPESELRRLKREIKALGKKMGVK